MNNFWKKKFSYVLLFCLGVSYLYYHHSSLAILKDIVVENLLIITTFSFGTFLFLAIQFKLLLEIFCLDLRFKEWFGLTVINTMISYYTPVRGGLVARAYYLNRKYNLSYSRYAALLGGSYSINFFVASLGTIFFILSAGLYSGFFNQNILRLGAGLLFGTVVANVLLFKLCSRMTSFKLGKYGQVLGDVAEGVALFRKRPLLVAKIALVQFCVIVIMGGKLYWSFEAIGKTVGLLDILAVQCLVTFSMLVSITPGNLGIKEGVIGLLASQFGVPFADAVLAASVDRGVSMFTTFLFGLIYSKILLCNEP